jgi:enoyl-CoA hydratase
MPCSACRKSPWALSPDSAAPSGCPRLIGSNRAKEMIFTGKLIPAAEAEKIGMVNRVLPQASLLEETLKTARTIATKGKVSLQSCQTGGQQRVERRSGHRLPYRGDAFSICMASEDGKEGTRAFIEKRKPQFKGSLKG